MDIQIEQILFQILNFSILMFVLNRFLYKPILKVLEARSEKVKTGLEAAEKSLEEQAKSDEKRKQMLTQTEKESAKILEKAQQEAKQIGKDIVKQAKKDASETVKKEYKILQAKIKDEEQKVRRNIASLITDTTETVLAGALNDKSQRQIIKSQIASLGKKGKLVN